MIEQIEMIKKKYALRKVYICLNVHNDGQKIPMYRIDKVQDSIYQKWMPKNKNLAMSSLRNSENLEFLQ